jgi:hypothetical protein
MRQKPSARADGSTRTDDLAHYRQLEGMLLMLLESLLSYRGSDWRAIYQLPPCDAGFHYWATLLREGALGAEEIPASRWQREGVRLSLRISPEWLITQDECEVWIAGNLMPRGHVLVHREPLPMQLEMLLPGQGTAIADSVAARTVLELKPGWNKRTRVQHAFDTIRSEVVGSLVLGPNGRVCGITAVGKRVHAMLAQEGIKEDLGYITKILRPLARDLLLKK